MKQHLIQKLQGLQDWSLTDLYKYQSELEEIIENKEESLEWDSIALEASEIRSTNIDISDLAPNAKKLQSLFTNF